MKTEINFRKSAPFHFWKSDRTIINYTHNYFYDAVKWCSIRTKTGYASPQPTRMHSVLESVSVTPSTLGKFRRQHQRQKPFHHRHLGRNVGWHDECQFTSVYYQPTSKTFSVLSPIMIPLFHIVYLFTFISRCFWRKMGETFKIVQKFCFAGIRTTYLSNARAKKNDFSSFLENPKDECR